MIPDWDGSENMTANARRLPYEEQRTDALEVQLRERCIQIKGNKADLVSKLRGHDAGQPQIKHGCSVSHTRPPTHDEKQHMPTRVETLDDGHSAAQVSYKDLESRVQTLEARVDALMQLVGVVLAVLAVAVVLVNIY